MAVLNKGHDFSDGDQVTAAKLDNAVDAATFAAGAVDNASTQLSGGAIIVKDAGITAAKLAANAVTTAKIADANVTTDKIADANVTPAKLSTGAPTWDGTGTGLMYLDGGGNDAANIELYGSSHPTSASQMLMDAGLHVFRSANGLTEHAKIDSGGRVVIGAGAARDPNAKFNVISSAAPGYGGAFSVPSTANSYHVFFFNPNGPVGSISTNGSACAYNTSSDYRLKENILDIENSVERLKQLKPCNFAWKADGSRVDGFIAHEAQAVVPEAVHGTKDELNEDGTPKYQGIDQSKLIPLLTKALQEALVRIEALENA